MTPAIAHASNTDNMIELPKIHADAVMPKSALNLLHVQDDQGDVEAVRRACEREFTKDGCTIWHAASLDEATRRLKESRFDAVLLDLTIADGHELGSVNAIKEENPDVPIVVLGGLDDTQSALNAVRLGAQEYVVKEFSNSRMLRLAILSSIERKAYERQLFKQANYDLLTGLPNRRMFIEYMDKWLTRAARWKRTEALMFLDVNGFKLVNDTFGHDAGDMLLQQIAGRLKACLRASDMLARYAGDEFVIHLDSAAVISREICAQVAGKITDLFLTPIRAGTHDVQTGVSVGIALYPDDGKTTAELIQSADVAMYRAKLSVNRVAFVPPKPEGLSLVQKSA